MADPVKQGKTYRQLYEEMERAEAAGDDETADRLGTILIRGMMDRLHKRGQNATHSTPPGNLAPRTTPGQEDQPG